MLGAGRLEIHRRKVDPRQPPGRHPRSQLPAVHPRRANQFKGFAGAPALADRADALKDAHARIKQVCRGTIQAGRRQQPWQIRLVKIHLPSPPLHGNYREIAAHPVFSVYIPGKLPHGHGRAGSQPVIPNDGVHGRRAYRALHRYTANGRHPVQHHHAFPRRCAGLHDSGTAMQVFKKARSRLTDVKHNRIHPRQHFRRGRDAFPVKDALHLHAGHPVHIGRHPLPVHKFSPDAINGIEKRCYLIPPAKHIHRRAQVFVHRSSAAHNAKALSLQFPVHLLWLIDAIPHLLHFCFPPSGYSDCRGRFSFMILIVLPYRKMSRICSQICIIFENELMTFAFFLRMWYSETDSL